MRCLRAPPSCCAHHAVDRTDPTPLPALSRRACVVSAPLSLAATLSCPPRAAARPVPDQSVAQRVYEETRPSVVGIANFRIVDGAVADVQQLGSGVVWDQRGYVVTAYAGVSRATAAAATASSATPPGTGVPAQPTAPLIQGASMAQSTAAAGRQLRVSVLDASVSPPQLKQFPAELVGVSALHNLAVLLISDAPQEILAPIPLGSNADVRVGQAAFAVGLPFGLSSHSLSYGIISGARRPVPSGVPGLLLPGGAFLTDASVDVTTSGGAMVDSSGRLMGMLLAPPNSTRASALGLTRPSSLSFAVPVDVLARIVPQLIAFGDTRPS